MMQDGLHIGLSAWIHRQRKSAGFAVYPASPITTKLTEIEGIQDISESAYAAEFSRLVNFIPRLGQLADPFNETTVLWRVHRDVLVMMDHATEPWSEAERASYQAAQDVLFTTDAAGFLTPSRKRLQYDEYRIAYLDLQRSYQDLQLEGSSSAQEMRELAGEIAAAWADWILSGYKNEVDNAFETITAFGARSSLGPAQNEALLLSEDPPGIGLRFHGDMEFAATYFAPISAIDRLTWSEAKVSFRELDDAVGRNPPDSQWKGYLENRVGEVSFSYVVLNCMRPWFSSSLYQADDWRLRHEGTQVSKGNGAEGLLPAYVEAVYLANVTDVTNSSPYRPNPRNNGGSGRLGELRMQPTLSSRALGHTTANSKRMGKEMDSPLIMRQHKVLKVDIPNTGAPVKATLLPPRANFVATKTGQVRKLASADVRYRYAVMQAYLADQSWRPTTQPEITSSQIYAVGFGCEKIPFAPNPNVNYRWD